MKNKLLLAPGWLGFGLFVSGCCPIPFPFDDTVVPSLTVTVTNPAGPVKGADVKVIRYESVPHFRPETALVTLTQTDQAREASFAHESETEWHMPLMMHGIPGFGWKLCVEASGHKTVSVTVDEFNDGKPDNPPQAIGVVLEPGSGDDCLALLQNANGMESLGQKHVPNDLN